MSRTIDDLADLPDGTDATVVARDDGAELSSEQIADLAKANAEADRGELVAAEEILRRLDARRARSATSRS
jgi:hypothetical protein